MRKEAVTVFRTITVTGILAMVLSPMNLYALTGTDTLYRRPLSEVNLYVYKQRAGFTPDIHENMTISQGRQHGTLNISFNAGVSHMSSLRIFSAEGRSMAALFEGATDNSTRKCQWNHEGFPAGIYCIRLESDNVRAVKKMNLLR
jgi:hypothetical protein